MKIFFLLNPTHPKRLWDLRQAGSDAARRHGWTPRFGEVDRTRPGSTDLLLRQAREEGCSRVVAVGGDGTLNRVFSHLRADLRLRDVEVGHVPAGTCNDFARALRLSSRRFPEAFEIACTGHVREMDLGDMNGQLFFNNAGFGRNRNPMAKRSTGPLQSLKSFQPIALKATWDKGSIEGSFFMGLVCNSAYFSGGFHFSRLPRVDDGILDFFLVPKMPKAKLAAIVLLGRLGRPLKTRHLISIRATEMQMDADRDLWPQPDGEPCIAPVRSVRFSLLKEKARFVFPL